MKTPKIGFLGGGQLGRMLLQEALNYPIVIGILDPDPNAPCKNLTTDFHVGNYKNYEDVYAFGKNYDILSIEIEHVNIEALEQLEKEGKMIVPEPAVLRIIQNKRKQKEFYKAQNIPTSEFVVCTNKDDIKENFHLFPVFQKLETDGYDGKGVQLLQTQEDLVHAFDKPSLLEKKVQVAKEISVIVSGDLKGNYVYYPPVEMVFDPSLNLVDYLVCPANITQDLANECIAIALRTAKAFNIKGILAVELFIDEQGQVLVNEVAPRTHNSGHHTIEACFTSQFEQQLRILLGLPLGSTALILPALMYNLIGEPGHTGDTAIEGLDQIDSDKLYLHLYGKKTTKPGRKMGHITLLDEDINRLKHKVHEVKKHIRIISKH